jgi:4a-hydroxytetrahydrobiopterin dehydratase
MMTACPSVALAPDEIQRNLFGLPQWQYIDNALERTDAFNTYLEALEFVNQVARLSEASEHHPDLLLTWKQVRVRYWTHTAHGVTQRDFELARQVDQALGQSKAAQK